MVPIKIDMTEVNEKKEDQTKIALQIIQKMEDAITRNSTDLQQEVLAAFNSMKITASDVVLFAIKNVVNGSYKIDFITDANIKKINENRNDDPLAKICYFIITYPNLFILNYKIISPEEWNEIFKLRDESLAKFNSFKPQNDSSYDIKIRKEFNIVIRDNKTKVVRLLENELRIKRHYVLMRIKPSDAEQQFNISETCKSLKIAINDEKTEFKKELIEAYRVLMCFKFIERVFLPRITNETNQYEDDIFFELLKWLLESSVDGHNKIDFQANQLSGIVKDVQNKLRGTYISNKIGIFKLEGDLMLPKNRNKIKELITFALNTRNEFVAEESLHYIIEETGIELFNKGTNQLELLRACMNKLDELNNL
jgi:hypothetical protein